MANKNTTIDKFADDLLDMLITYTDDVKEATSEEVMRVGESGALQLRGFEMPPATASGLPPAEFSTRRSWKKYSSSWTALNDERYNYTSSTIHNRKHFQLVHLLEFGHSTRIGTHTRAFAHVKPVEDKCEKELLDNVKKIIEKGGKL